MKAPLIIGSMLGNLLLGGLVVYRPAIAPAGVHDFVVRHFHSGSTAPAAAHVAKAKTPIRRTPWWSIVHDDDPRTFIARLRAAGFPPAIIRALVSAELSARYNERMQAIQEPDPNTPFWKMRPTFFTLGDKRLEEMNQLQRERAKVMRDLFADDFFASDDVISSAQRRQFGDLPRAKIDALQRIEDDYNEMTGAIRSGMNGIMLREDRDKLALLAREKRADLAAVLSPQELADYEMRSSPTTNFLRSRLSGFDPSEAEFRAIFQVQQTLNEKFPDFGNTDYDSRIEAQKIFYDGLRAAVGDKRYADYVRETNNEFQQLSRLADRAALPRETAVQTFNLRETVAQESGRIFDDPALSPDAKRAALQSLAQDTRTKILATLGPSAGPEYVKIADSWLSNVERGAAVSFNRALPVMVVSDRGSFGFSNAPEYRRLPNPAQPGH